MASNCRLFAPIRVHIAAVLISVGSAVPLFSNQASTTSTDLQIYLQTYSPGQGLEAMFGHSALRITDIENGRDSIYNFGAYDFDDPLFFYRLLTGTELRFSLSVRPAEVVLNEYLETGRSVKEQLLNLDQKQSVQLLEYLQSEARPENREYRYDFLERNCSTRIRELIESVTADALLVSSSATGVSEHDTGGPPITAPLTLREHLHEYLHDHPWVRLGIDTVLDGGLDTPVDVREAAYLPEGLYEWAARARIEGNTGPQPFVSAERMLFPPAEMISGDTPLPFILTPIFVVTALTILYGIAILRCIRRRRYCPSLPFIAFLHSGIVGLFLVVVQFGSGWGHCNWILLLMYPTDLVAAAALSATPRAKTLRSYALSTAGISALTLLALPIIPQYINPALIPLILAQVAGKGYLFQSQRLH
jgi:hypothetical protein